MKILVIENNRTSMKLVCEILAKTDHEIICAVNGEKGLELARLELPQLIIMDIMLPGIDGLEVTRLLREDPATSHIKVVAHTALAMAGDKERILAAGCDGYIPKPFDYKDFISLIKKT